MVSHDLKVGGQLLKRTLCAEPHQPVALVDATWRLGPRPCQLGDFAERLDLHGSFNTANCGLFTGARMSEGRETLARHLSLRQGPPDPNQKQLGAWWWSERHDAASPASFEGESREEDLAQADLILGVMKGAAVEAFREIARLRLATDEGTLRERADRMWQIAEDNLHQMEDEVMSRRKHSDGYVRVHVEPVTPESLRKFAAMLSDMANKLDQSQAKAGHHE